jgi:hypothetical protein
MSCRVCRQVAAADLEGARSMVVSSTTLSKGAGDLHTQVWLD